MRLKLPSCTAAAAAVVGATAARATHITPSANYERRPNSLSPTARLFTVMLVQCARSPAAVARRPPLAAAAAAVAVAAAAAATAAAATDAAAI